MALIRSNARTGKKNSYLLGVIDGASGYAYNIGTLTLAPEDLEGFSNITVSNKYGSGTFHDGTYRIVKNGAAGTGGGAITIGTSFSIPSLRSGESLMLQIRIDGTSTGYPNMYDVSLS